MLQRHVSYDECPMCAACHNEVMADYNRWLSLMQQYNGAHWVLVEPATVPIGHEGPPTDKRVYVIKLGRVDEGLIDTRDVPPEQMETYLQQILQENRERERTKPWKQRELENSPASNGFVLVN